MIARRNEASELPLNHLRKGYVFKIRPNDLYADPQAGGRVLERCHCRS
jgi:hypothetical protein